jgi:PEP-CTERM motif
MKCRTIALLGAAVIATLAASSAAQAAIIGFSFGAFGGSMTHDGASLDVSSVLDLDEATLLVMEVNPGDSSGLADFAPVKISSATSPPGTAIMYGFGDKPSDFPTSLGAKITLSWPVVAGPGTDVFTETLTTVLSIDRDTPDAITVVMSGTVSDTMGLFTDSPTLLQLQASQDLGATLPTVTFTNESGLVPPAVPEPSTWVMMALGFGALGYAAIRRGKANGALRPI